jgi:hypothetical protein
VSQLSPIHLFDEPEIRALRAIRDELEDVIRRLVDFGNHVRGTADVGLGTATDMLTDVRAAYDALVATRTALNREQLATCTWIREGRLGLDPPAEED